MNVKENKNQHSCQNISDLININESILQETSWKKRETICFYIFEGKDYCIFLLCIIACYIFYTSKIYNKHTYIHTHTQTHIHIYF